MSKNLLIFIILAFMLVVSCSNQQQNTPLHTLESGSKTFTFTPLPTKAPSLVISSTPSLIITPTSTITILRNALIVYSAGEDVDVVPASGGMPTPIIENNEATFYDSPSWSPSGEQIIFAVRGNGISPKIYVIKRDGSGLRLLMSNAGNDPVWSPDGKHVAYTIDSGLYVTSTNGVGLQQLVKSPITGFFPSWSPNGKKLALLGNSAGNYGPFKIFLINSDGKNLHPITEAIVGMSHLAWSPDGSKIAFRSFEGCGDINVLDLRTGTITNLTNTPGIVDLDPAWSPDGNFIAFSKASYTPCEQDKVYAYQGENIYIMRADGQGVTQLTNAKGYQPSWWPTVVLRPGWKYSVTKAGTNLNIRESAVPSAKSLVKLQEGDIFTALDGPVSADNYQWWHVRTDTGVEGWGVDVPGWYMFESAPTSTP